MQRQARALIVYYSRSGTTANAARMIAEHLAGDVEELAERRSRLGLCGYLRSSFEATFGLLTDLNPTVHDPSAYDLVVLGTPVWDASISSPIRTYVVRNRRRFKHVAFFLTLGGTGAQRALRQLGHACQATPVATPLAIDSLDLRSGAAETKAAEFAEILQGYLMRAAEYAV